MDRQRADVQPLFDLLLDYANTLMGAGSHTSRVVKNVQRIADSYGYNADITIFQMSIMVTLTDKKEPSVRGTLIKKIKPIALNFQIISRLSNLSWEIYDNKLSLEEARERYIEIATEPRLSRWLVLILVAFANASFCRLFGGDFPSMGLVFAGTLAAFFVRQVLMARHMSHLVVFIIASFISSMIAGLGLYLGIGNTPEIALATSVLFLIPGVPMINSIIDFIEGHVLVGFTRLVNAGILIICLSLGFFLTLLIYGVEKL